MYYNRLTQLRYDKGLDRDIIPNIYNWYDMETRPSASRDFPKMGQLVGGIFEMEFDSTDDDDFFYQWLLSGEMNNGKMIFYKGDHEDQFIKIIFGDCYCTEIGERMSSVDCSPMKMRIQISPAITENRGIKHEKSWKVTEITNKPFKPEHYAPPISLVTAVKGEQTALPHSKIEYSVTDYNINVPQGDKDRVKWAVEVDGKQELQKQQGEKVILTMKEEWVGKDVTVMPYLKKPIETVSVKTKVKKWKFPIIIDRYKMPGLNETGTDIAKDMCYGYGIAPKKTVYPPVFVKELVDSYKHKHCNIKLNPILSNIADYDPTPPFFLEKTNILQNIERAVRIKHAKAIYDEKHIPEAIYRLKEYVRACSRPIQTTIKTIADLFKSDKRKLQELKMTLFDDFRAMVNLFFTSNDNPEMRQNILAMIDKFQRNEGGVYESQLLTKNIENHPSTIRYCKGGKRDGIETYIHQQLKDNDGDISKLLDETIYWKDIDSKRGQKKVFSATPLFPGDIPLIGSKEKIRNATDGYTIALNDIWATEVAITDYTLNGKDYKVTYRVTLWDHFGLDLPDIQPGKVAGYLDGFRAWFILQHFLGYKPFITKITFTKEFKGSL